MDRGPRGQGSLDSDALVELRQETGTRHAGQLKRLDWRSSRVAMGGVFGVILLPAHKLTLRWQSQSQAVFQGQPLAAHSNLR
jgi:hypothetical protein